MKFFFQLQNFLGKIPFQNCCRLEKQKKVGALKVLLPSISDGLDDTIIFERDQWLTKCSLYMEITMAFQICEIKTLGLYLISISVVAKILE